MAKRLIGYAVTDSNGIATLNYIGQGLGEVDIVAETGGEMLFHYIGTGGTETDSFYYNTTDIQVTSNSTGTTVSNTGSVGRTYWANKSGTSSTGTNVDADWNAPLTVEFDVVSYTGNATGIAFQLVVSTPSTIAVSKNFNDLGITSNNHIKLTYDGAEVKWYVDDVLKYTQSYSQSNFSIRFYIVNGNSFKYKNFFIYRGSTQLTSDPITLFDCTVYDDMETTQYETKYKRDNTATISYSTDWAVTGTKSIKWDIPSAPSGNAGYWGLLFIANPTSTAFDIEWVKGKTLQFETDTKTIGTTSSNAFTIVAYLKTTTNTSWSKIGEYAVPSGEAHNKTVVATGQTLTYEIPSNATQFWLRFGSLGTASKTLYIDNWKLYPI